MGGSEVAVPRFLERLRSSVSARAMAGRNVLGETTEFRRVRRRPFVRWRVETARAVRTTTRRASRCARRRRCRTCPSKTICGPCPNCDRRSGGRATGPCSSCLRIPASAQRGPSFPREGLTAGHSRAAARPKDRIASVGPTTTRTLPDLVNCCRHSTVCDYILLYVATPVTHRYLSKRVESSHPGTG